jgi:hypothetical protein
MVLLAICENIVEQEEVKSARPKIFAADLQRNN